MWFTLSRLCPTGRGFVGDGDCLGVVCRYGPLFPVGTSRATDGGLVELAIAVSVAEDHALEVRGFTGLEIEVWIEDGTECVSFGHGSVGEAGLSASPTPYLRLSGFLTQAQGLVPAPETSPEVATKFSVGVGGTVRQLPSGFRI